MTAFFSVIQPADTSPYDSFVTTRCPCASAIWCSALSAYKQFSQRIFRRVFTKLGFRTNLLDLPQSAASGNFFLNLAESYSVNDGRMVVFDIVFGAFAVVSLFLFGDTINGVGLIDYRIAHISLFSENGMQRTVSPLFFSTGSQNVIAFQLANDCLVTVACEKPLIYVLNRFGFFGNNFRFAVISFAISEEIFVVEGYVALAGGLFLAPLDVCADILGFTLND